MFVHKTDENSLVIRANEEIYRNVDLICCFQLIVVVPLKQLRKTSVYYLSSVLLNVYFALKLYSFYLSSTSFRSELLLLECENWFNFSNYCNMCLKVRNFDIVTIWVKFQNSRLSTVTLFEVKKPALNFFSDFNQNSSLQSFSLCICFA